MLGRSRSNSELDDLSTPELFISGVLLLLLKNQLNDKITEISIKLNFHCNSQLIHALIFKTNTSHI